MGWDFAGKWLAKRLPIKNAHRELGLKKETYDKLCEADKQILTEELTKHDVFIYSVTFYMFVIAAAVFGLKYFLR